MRPGRALANDERLESMMRQGEARIEEGAAADAIRNGSEQPGQARQPGTLRKAWRGWLKLAEIIGAVQMVIILSVVYWTLLAITAIFYKMLADPLAIRRSRRGRWVERQPVAGTLDAIRRQY